MEGMYFFDPAGSRWLGYIRWQMSDQPWCLIMLFDPATGEPLHHRWVPYTAVTQWQLYATKEEALRAYEEGIA
jgi:hypothetical protein